MGEFNGKVALVTGGGRGIGREIALMLSEEGASVAIASRTREELEETAKLIEQRGGARAQIIPADISKDEEIKRVYAELKAHFGGLDILINNAGVAFEGEFGQNTEEQIDKMVNVNYRALLLSTKEALKLMEKGGKIINVASIAGKTPFAGLAAYSGTKAAVIGFTKALAEELKERGIKAYSVCPGATKTKMWDKLYPGSPAAFEAKEVAAEVKEMLENESLEPGEAVNVRHHK